MLALVGVGVSDPICERSDLSALLQHLPLLTTSSHPDVDKVGAGDRSEWKEVLSYVGPHEEPGEPGQEHSQVGQDWLVASLLGCMRTGFFLDLAANDAVRLSNTLMLERDFGWDGICVEANPQYLPSLVKRRCTVVLAAVGSPKGKSVTFALRGVLGGIVGNNTDNKKNDGESVTFRLEPLAELLSHVGAPRIINYFSLDVEGAESMVMQGFPWDRYTFQVLTVERPKDDLRGSLRSHGYHFVRTNSDFDDETWVHESLPEFEEKMAAYQNGAMSGDNCMTARGLSWPTKLRL